MQNTAEAPGNLPDPASLAAALYASPATYCWHHTPEGALIGANPAFLRAVGRRPEELLRLSLADLMPADDCDRYRKHLERRLAALQPAEPMELRLAAAAAEPLWVEVEVVPLGPAGEPCSFLALARDISARRAGEEALSACREKYMRFFLSAPDIMAVLSQNGRLIEINEKFEAEFGLDRLAVIGRSLTEGGILSGGSVKRLRRHLRRLRDGAPAARFEILGRTRDGREVPFEVHAVPIESRELVPAVLASLRNIEEQKARQAALAQSEETARALLNSVDHAAYLLDVTGVVLASNLRGAEHFGFTPEGLAGRPITDLLPPEAGARRRDIGLEVVRTGKSLKFEDEVDRSVFETAIHPVLDEAGRVVKLAVYSRDVTEERRDQEERRKLTIQLQQAQKMEAIGTLAGGIAHDFNNLLMAIQGNVSLMQFDLEPGHKHGRVLANIEKLVRSGAELTSKLLGYARRGRYETRSLTLNELVRETSETFNRMRKDITIHFDLDPGIQAIIADRGQIEQVLLNLFVNAADAMPTGGRLVLSTRNVDHGEIPYRGYAIKEGRYVRLTVTDTGSGMEPAVMARIFEPFFTTKQMGHGTGLGLASAYGIVKGHNGYIDVTSEVGKGTTFYLYFPATDRVAAEEPGPASPQAQRGAGTILLVDDEEVVLAVTAEMIERLGYTVIMAGSGPEAIEKYRRHRESIRMVILDMVMPEMSGGEVFDELRRIDPEVKVLLASGFSLQGQARTIMQRGCSGFIQKPFGIEDLSVKMRLILK
jgi:PAS domain S-box-containing protein